MGKCRSIQRWFGRNSLTKTITALLMAFSLMIIPVFAYLPAQVAAEVPTPTPFSNPATVEDYVKNLFQTALDNMDSEVSFEIGGVQAVRVFLEIEYKKDIYGNLVLDGEGKKIPIFTTKSSVSDFFKEQLMDMNINYGMVTEHDNYNAYSRLALESFSFDGRIVYTPDSQGNIIGVVLTAIYTIKWRDGSGEIPISGRNAVISDARKFLDSPSFPNDGTDDQKLKAINKYICETFQYDDSLSIYTAYKMITDTEVYKRGVCQAYAMYGYIMLREAGYETITINGDAGNPAGPHAWNMVKVGSNWYHIDFTWNDSGGVSLNNFMRTDAEISQNNHFWTIIPTWDEIPVEGYIYPSSTVVWTGIAPIVTQPITPPPTVTLAPTPTKMIIPTATQPPPSISIEPSSDSSSFSESISSDPSVDVSSADSKYIVLSQINVVSGIGDDSTGEQPTIGDEKTVSITGKLLDYLGNPISGMKILLYNTGKTSTTGNDGNYRFNDVKVGSYKIFIINNSGIDVAELPIVISFGEQTLVSDGSVQIRGGSLQMDLTLSGEVLLIKSVSSPKFIFTKEVIVYIVMVVMVLAAVTLFVIFKKDRNKVDINMD